MSARARGLASSMSGAKGDAIELARPCEPQALAHATDACAMRARPIDVVLPLAGDFQASNALVAAGMAIATGEAPDARVRGARKLARRAGPHSK